MQKCLLVLDALLPLITKDGFHLKRVILSLYLCPTGGRYSCPLAEDHDACCIYATDVADLSATVADLKSNLLQLEAA